MSKRETNLPDPEDYPERDLVVFDGVCRFCCGQVRNLHRVDLTGRLAFISLHDPRMKSWHPDLSEEQLMKEIYVIHPNGDRFSGSEGVKSLSRRVPAMWLISPFLHVPGTSWFWSWAYNQIAIRRYRIAGKMEECGDQCAVHFDRSKKLNKGIES